jgi:hypothetical protein
MKERGNELWIKNLIKFLVDNVDVLIVDIERYIKLVYPVIIESVPGVVHH